MLFTTQIFIFIFLPACLGAYYLICGISRIGRLNKIIERTRLKDFVIIVFSLGFYMWACFDNVFRLIFYMLVVYMLALWIDAAKRKGGYLLIKYETSLESDNTRKLYLAMLVLAIAVVSIVFCLVYYNYSDFIINCWNKVFGDNVAPKSLAAPLGLSFITFSAVSYLTDIYRGNARPGGVGLFPVPDLFPEDYFRAYSSLERFYAADKREKSFA